jgi:hypothetical protein
MGSGDKAWNASIAMLISHKLRFIFIHIPRTGGTSIENALGRAVDDAQQIIRSHATISELKTHPKYQAFAWVRDPWDRALSVYAYYVRRKFQAVRSEWQPSQKEFFEFLKSPPLDIRWAMRQQTAYITGRHVEIGRFENLEHDFREMCRLIGLPLDIELRHLNGTDSLALSGYYDKWAIWRVRELFPQDVEQLGYSTPEAS